MKTVSSLTDLSISELIKIRRQLQRRFGIGRRGNMIDIAFGMAESNGRIDPSRPDTICFYVRHKRKPRAKIDRIPKTLEFRLKRGRRFVRVQLDTDVILIGTRNVLPCGQSIVHQHSKEKGTTGGVIIWRRPNQNHWTWGLITVGHLFTGVNVVPESSARVRIGRSAAYSIEGTLIARSESLNRQFVDAAVVMVSRSSLIAAKLIPPNGPTQAKRIRPLNRLKGDQGNRGFTFPEQLMINLRVVRFLPLSDMVPALGTLRYVVEAIAVPGTFGIGRSGSLWAVQRQVASMQHGGLPPLFYRGWGQALDFALQWCAQEIATIEGVPTSDLDLRLVRVI